MKENIVEIWTTFPNTGRPNTLTGSFMEKDAIEMWKRDSSLNWGKTWIDSDGFVQWV